MNDKGKDIYLEDKYLVFFREFIENRKTPIISIFNKLNGSFLGNIKFYPNWRQYCFFPMDNSVFHDGCLEKIVECVKMLNAERDNERKLKKNGEVK